MKLYMDASCMPSFSKHFSDMWNSVYPPDQVIFDKNILNITLVTNEDCNFKCSYCYQKNKTKNRLSRETGKKIIDFILDDSKLNSYADSASSPCIILEFIGGEPFLNIDVIDYVVDYFKYRSAIENHQWATNYMISISTNGSLYNTPKVQKFIAKNHNHVSIGITIDGTKELHNSCRVYPDGRGTYDDVARNVELWKAQGFTPTTKLTIAPENLRYLSEAIIHLFNMGFITVFANTVFENVWEVSNARAFYSQLIKLADTLLENDLYVNKYTSLFSEQIGQPLPENEDNNWCGGDGSMIAFGTDGTIYPCLRYMEYSLNNQKPLVIGHIDTKIHSKEDSVVIQKLTSITRKSQSSDKCFNCPIASGCAWCSGFNYDEFGTPNKRATYICDMHKARILANRYFWQKLYRKLNLDMEFKLNIPKDWTLEIVTEQEYTALLNL